MIMADSKIKKESIFNNETFVHYLMLAPFAVFFIVFTVLPVLYSIVLSFFNYDMLSSAKFAGIANYYRMFIKDTVFWKTVLNTLKFAIITGPIGFMISFILAWFINEFNPIVRNLLAFLFYVPSLAGNVYFVWQIAFSGDSYGYINSFLLKFGFITEPINWFSNTSYNMGVLIIIQLWLSMGMSFLANISGLQNTNVELYEAGAIDGIRTRWHELWYITLPSMKSILLFSAVMQIQGSFSIGAIEQALSGYPSPDNSVDTIVTMLGDVGTVRYEMGYAAAISVFLFAMMAITRVLIGKVMDSLSK